MEETAKCPRYTREIPLHLIADILSIVPAKDLIRFKSVRKEWCSLIQDPAFIHLHLRRSEEQDSRKLIKIFRMALGCNNVRYHLTICSVDKYGIASSIHPKPYILGSINTPSCNGLLCYITPESNLEVSNPITGENITLPKPSILRKRANELCHQNNTMIAIGFDPHSKLYKILGWNVEHDSDVEVFTLGTNSWRKITGFSVRTGAGDVDHHGSVYNYYEPVYMDGVSYWCRQIWFAGSRRSKKEIMYFDYGEENFGIIKVPSVIDPFNDRNFLLCESRGHICIVEKQEKNSGEQKLWVITLWLLNKNEDGTHEWKHQPPINVPSNGVWFGSRAVAIGNGEILLGKQPTHFLDSYNEQGDVVNSIILNQLEGWTYLCFDQFHSGSLVRLT